MFSLVSGKPLHIQLWMLWLNTNCYLFIKLSAIHTLTDWTPFWDTLPCKWNISDDKSEASSHLSWIKWSFAHSVCINLEGLFVGSKRTVKTAWRLGGGRELCRLLFFPSFFLPLDTQGTQEWHWGLEAQMDSNVQLSPAGCEAGLWGYSCGVSRDLFCLCNEIREQGSAGELSCWDSSGVVFQWKGWI